MKPSAWLALAVLITACHEAPSQARFAVRGRWPGEREIVYRIEAERGAQSPAAFARAIRSALDEWAATGCATFREARPDELPALAFAWARDAHGECVPFGTDPSVAHAGPVGPGTFVHFDAGHAWDSGALRRAALHEIGHVLGLDHSPDEASVMYPEPSPSRARLSASDLAGIHSLYGGGSGASGDLVITSGGGELVLRAVAPAALVAWTAFDTDGDGDAELVTWRTDAAGHGALWSYHFASDPALARTLGPVFGVAAMGAELELVRTSGGERLVILRPAQGGPRARIFDAHGIPQPYGGEVPPGAGASARDARPVAADLDGDGRVETIVRRE